MTSFNLENRGFITRNEVNIWNSHRCYVKTKCYNYMKQRSLKYVLSFQQIQNGFEKGSFLC